MVSALVSGSSGPGSSPGRDIVLCTGELNAGENPAINWHPIQGGVAILLVASC